MNMKKFLYLIISIAFISCNDGDLLVEDLEFDNAAVQICDTPLDQTTTDYLFYIIDNTDNETISLAINTTDPILTASGIYGGFPLSTNTLQYRKLNGPAGADYYCNNVPPVTPLSTQIFIGEAGEAFIESTVIEDDGDGIDAIDEGIDLNDLSLSLDTDGDGLPDYKDTDDDNDNVPTSDELNQTDPTIVVDTDGDGIPNYKDNDDDGDLVLTIQESTDGDIFPSNDEIGGVKNYLNNQVTATANPPVASYDVHRFTTSTKLVITITALTVVSEERQIIISNYDFGTYSRTLTTTLTPTF